MQVSVSAEELKQTAELLELLERFKTLRSISGCYNQGEVTLSMKGNAREHIGYEVDRYGTENYPTKTPVQRCHRDIKEMMGQYATKMATDACDIITKHMPIPVTGW